MQTLTGQLEGTMSRNDAYTFMMLGRNLERADMTSRIIDVRSAQLLPADAPGFQPFETIQWINVLNSLSGYQMYRLSQRTRVSRSAVLEFVLRDRQFPRACLFCLKEVEHYLQALPRSAEVLGSLGEACGFLASAQPATLDQPALHELLDRLQLHIIIVHEGIAQSYFPLRAGASGQSQLQFSSDERQKMPRPLYGRRLLQVADCTSSVQTLKLTSVLAPNVVLIATSIASRPLAISTRPIRGTLLRGSKVYQRPPRYASNQAAKSIGP